MLAIINSIEDGVEKNLCFASRDDAERFKSFVNIYMEESGAGNGYGAYWVFFNANILEVSENPGYSKELKENLLRDMLDSVMQARTAGENVGTEVKMFVKSGGEGIEFDIGTLPDRICPSIGDMFRSLRSFDGPRLEGRVINSDGEILKVVSCWDEELDGKIRKDAEVILIESSKVMKINDWKAAHRQ